jgi:hypothetical protein
LNGDDLADLAALATNDADLRVLYYYENQGGGRNPSFAPRSREVFAELVTDFASFSLYDVDHDHDLDFVIPMPPLGGEAAEDDVDQVGLVVALGGLSRVTSMRMMVVVVVVVVVLMTMMMMMMMMMMIISM